jgi:hypothetical protein
MAKRNYPEDKKLFTPSEAGEILGVDPKTVTSYTKPGGKDKDVKPKLDAVLTPGGTRRITADSLVSSGVCRKCWTLRSLGGQCEC